MRTPPWAGKEDIYFMVIEKETNNKYGYIGLQGLDFQKGVCDNFCYKTNKKFRGQGKSKHYLKEFLDWCPLYLDIFKASVKRDNVASIKMLEYCGFEEVVKKVSKTQEDVNALEKKVKELEKKVKEDKDDSTSIILLGSKKRELTYAKEVVEESRNLTFRLKRFDF